MSLNWDCKNSQLRLFFIFRHKLRFEDLAPQPKNWTPSRQAMLHNLPRNHAKRFNQVFHFLLKITITNEHITKCFSSQVSQKMFSYQTSFVWSQGLSLWHTVLVPKSLLICLQMEFCCYLQAGQQVKAKAQEDCDAVKNAVGGNKWN